MEEESELRRFPGFSGPIQGCLRTTLAGQLRWLREDEDPDPDGGRVGSRWGATGTPPPRGDSKKVSKIESLH